MATPNSNERDGPRGERAPFLRRNRPLLLAMPVALGIAVLMYFFMQSYVIDQVEKRVRDTMLECRALHHYVQRDMHPAYYKLMEDGELPAGFYAPELLSSSFMVRNLQRHFNSERRKKGLPEVVYKMAAVDPRNPLNKATPREQELIAWFNKDRSRQQHREIVEENGRKYLLYAQPFPRVQKRCLKCHGTPGAAPAQLRDKYDWTGAWNYEVGDVIAAEFIRSPLKGEYNTAAWFLGVAVVLLAAGLVLLAFNTRLGTLVASRTRALAEERQRFANVIEGTKVGTWDWNVQTGVLVANERWAEMIGYTLEELAPLAYDTWSRLCHPEDLVEAKRLIQTHFEGEGTCYEATFRLKHKAGHWVWTYGRGSVITWDDQGQPLRMYGTHTDVTDEVQLKEEKAVLEAEYHQAQKVESVGRLAGGVAHDLNNLLTPVIGYAEILIEDLEPADERRTSAEEIMAAGLRARDLVAQLLAFSRKQTLTFEPVDVNQALEGFETLLRRTIREDIEIKFLLAPELQPVLADPGQIEQIVMNLAVNAADAMPDGGRLSFETSMEELDDANVSLKPDVKPGRFCLLAVSDTGTGMRDDVRENIFEPFYSTKGERGTGLGLATVYGIVKQHGGNIWVYSEPGLGTTFKIYLPVVDATDEAPPTTSDEPKITDLRGAEAVLLVEDDDQVCQLTRSVLERQGYSVKKKKKKKKKKTLMASTDRSTQLLLTDVILPGMNGKELHSAAVQIQPDLRVLYMSGYTDDVIAHHGVLNKGVQLLQKPFSSKNLLLKVREVLAAEVNVA